MRESPCQPCTGVTVDDTHERQRGCVGGSLTAGPSSCTHASGQSPAVAWSREELTSWVGGDRNDVMRLEMVLDHAAGLASEHATR